MLILSILALDALYSQKAIIHDTPPVNTSGDQSEASYDVDPCDLDSVDCENEVFATVTAYAAYKQFTDSTPCVSASGDYICGRTDVAACPRKIHMGTWIVVNGKKYQCLDRLAMKYDNRFDLFMDKDINAAKLWGRKQMQVTILE